MEVIIIAVLAFFSSAGAFRSVCYYTNWAQHRPANGTFLPENVDPSLCTHIIYAFAKPVDLHLKPFEKNDDDEASSKGMYTRVVALKERNPDLKVLLAVGGWNMASTPFIPLVQSQHSRTQFANNTVTFLRQRNFDGLDLDWQYPGSRGSSLDDKHKFRLLLEALKAEFEQEAQTSGKARLLLTAAVGAVKHTIDTAYEVPEIARILDFLNVMTYDFHGGGWEQYVGLNAPMYAHPEETGAARYLNLDWALKYWVLHGADKEKINVGIATYGRTFTLADPNKTAILSPATGAGDAHKYTREAGMISFYEVCDFIRDGSAKVVEVQSQCSHYASKGNQWVGYDDVENVFEKTCYAKRNGYGGVFFFALDFDDFEGKFCNKGPYPLLRASNEAVRSPLSCSKVLSNTFEIVGADHRANKLSNTFDIFGADHQTNKLSKPSFHDYYDYIYK